jgi:atypical dual specificity phosphatase
MKKKSLKTSFWSKLIMTLKRGATAFKRVCLASPTVALFSEMCIKNPFFWALSLFVTALVVMMTAVLALPPISATGIPICILTTIALVLVTLSKPMRKWLLCEVSLMGSALCYALAGRITSFILPACATRTWYTEITELLTLGAIPLKNRNHHQQLKREGYTAFLSLVEDFEIEPHLFGCPITPDYWEKEGFSFSWLPTPDLSPVAKEHIEKGIAFLHKQISRGKKVYVHCNAGVARSATIVICYLIRYHRMAVDEAVAFVKAKRWIAVNKESPAIQSFSGTYE